MTPLGASRLTARQVACSLGCLVGLAVSALLVQSHGLEALKAAGLVGQAPGQGGGAFKQLLATLQANAEWLMATGIGFGITLLALMFFVGSMRAPDYLLKIGLAVAIVLVVGPGIVA